MRENPTGHYKLQYDFLVPRDLWFPNFRSWIFKISVFKIEKFTEFDHQWMELKELKVKSMNFKFIQIYRFVSVKMKKIVHGAFFLGL